MSENPTGWAIHTTRCEHLDKQAGGEVYALNLVMPWSRREEDGKVLDDSLDGSGRGPAETGKTAFTRVDDLLLPWRWGDLKWKVFFGKPGAWQEVVDEKTFFSGTKVECELPLNQIADEIVAGAVSKTHECPFAFSVRGDDIDADVDAQREHLVTKRSLPHAMAPLTHWPAVVSNGALKLAGFIVLTDHDLAHAEINAGIVGYPQFALRDGVRRLVADKPEGVMDGPQYARYAGQAALRMVCQPAARDARLEVETGMKASQGDASVGSARALAARQLALLPVLARGVAELLVESEALSAEPAVNFITRFATDAALRAEWARVLPQSIGDGAGVPYTGLRGKDAKPHLLGRLSPQAGDPEKLLAPASGAAFDAALMGLVDREPGEIWPEASHVYWNTTRDAWRELVGRFMQDAGTSTLSEGRRFLRAWLEVARSIAEPETYRQLLGPWLGARLLPPALPTPDPDWAPALRAVLRREIVTSVDAHEYSFQALAIAIPALSTLLARPDEIVTGKDPATEIRIALDGACLRSLPSLKDAPAITGQFGPAAEAFVRALRHGSAPASPRPRDPGLTLTFETELPQDPKALDSFRFDQSVRGYAIALCSAMPTFHKDAWCIDLERAQWITDTAVYGRRPDGWLTGPGGKLTSWMHETIGSTLRNGLRVTSVEYQGAPVAAMPAAEDGALLGKDARNGDADGSDAIDFLWRMKTLATDADGRELPLLGYGLHYRAEATCIDNAGGVFDRSFRLQTDPSFTDLRPAKEHFAEAQFPDKNRAPQWQYRSAVPPGAPQLRTVKQTGSASEANEKTRFELSDETRAHAYELDRRRSNNEALGAPLPKVALLTHDEKLGDGALLFDAKPHAAHAAYTVAVEAPAAGEEFVERWLNTDIVWRQLTDTAKEEWDKPLGELSDPLFGQYPPEKLIAFRDLVIRRISQHGPAAESNDTEGLSWHPAVSALGVAVWADGVEAPLMTHAFRIKRTCYEAKADSLQPGPARRVTVVVAAAAAGVATTAVPMLDADGQSSLSIGVARGSFVRVRAFSLVDAKHFAPNDADSRRSPDCRYYSGIELAPAPSEWVPVFDGEDGAAPYHAFGPSELWFEAAPPWAGFLPDDFALQVIAPNKPLDTSPEPLAPGLMALQGQSAMQASWVKGLFVQRHEWHWTGYPVRLPGASPLAEWPLAEWLVSFAGVESYREGFEALLSTGFGAQGWKYGAAADGHLVIHKRPLQGGARPARYAAFTARSMVRFRAWLNAAKTLEGPLALEQKVYGAGTVIPGIAPINLNERLPTPPLRWAVPLTSTYRFETPGGGPDASTEPKHTARGNLLVCDDALRRTDEGARVGGIGDTLEIDLLHTRNPAYPEIGVNPIFHAKPDAKAARDVAAISLDVHPPFGLTHDISSNALVAQTGVVVSTRGGAGRWLLAKIRARRVLLPETLLDSTLRMVDFREGRANLRAATLPLRRDGDDMVPCDFALDAETFDRAPQFQIRLQGAPDAAPEALSVSWPKAPAGKGQAVRYLCSWHKDRWAGAGDPTWRLQVLGQTRAAAALEWRTITKASGFENSDYRLANNAMPTAAQIVETTAAGFHASIVRMSDYTDPMWLTFIGSFGRESLSKAEAYWLGVEGQSLVLHGPREHDTLPQLSAMASTAVMAQREPRFQLLLVYRPLADVTRGDARGDTGALVGAFVSEGTAMRFRGLRFNGADASTNLAGCSAYLCSMQRITSASKDEEARLQPQSFEALVALLFPDEGEESLLRLLPEYLGPIAVGDPAA